jgi:hypothetical protein
MHLQNFCQQNTASDIACLSELGGPYSHVNMFESPPSADKSASVDTIDSLAY